MRARIGADGQIAPFAPESRDVLDKSAWGVLLAVKNAVDFGVRKANEWLMAAFRCMIQRVLGLKEAPSKGGSYELRDTDEGPIL